MLVEAIGRICYTCELSEEDEEKVVNYIKDNPDEFEYMDAAEAIIEAVKILHEDLEIDLYTNSTESDYSTEEINWSCFEERKAEQILGIEDDDDEDDD